MTTILAQHPRPRLARRAFSLVEIVVSLVIIGTMFAASAWAVGAAARDRRVQADAQRGTDLCRLLLCEILEQKYQDPNGAAVDAPGVARSTWDDVADYNDLIERPLTTKTGTAIADASDWQRTVTVSYVTVASGSLTFAVGGATDTGIRRISVTATSPRGQSTTIVGYRCSAGTPDLSTPATGSVTWAGVTLSVGSDTRQLSTGADLMNVPAP